ncbi:MAG: SDR family oxidoreductase [Chitinophagaceae bacterium]|nr:SDR family oxidoreductase [Chitinophagaceae bacterium]
MKKTVLITGASSGIGRATAKKFAEKGWNVIATMRNPDKEKELNAINNVWVTTLDVEKADTIGTAIKNGIRQFGKIDVLINNAGQGIFGVFETTPEENIRKLFEVNFFGVLQVTRAILPYFREQKNGMIVNISSGTGRFTLPLMSIYSASKYGLEGFSESLSFELAAQNIKVKIIEPGMVDTNFDEATRNNYVADPNIPAYNDYINKMIGIFSGGDAGERKVTAGEAAGAIYDAVTDGSDTLRYIIGEDVKAMIAARSAMSDQEYMEMMQQRFAV